MDINFKKETKKMKKIIFVLSSILVLSCAKKNNSDQNDNGTEFNIPIKPQPEPVKPEPKPETEIVDLKFGDDGIVALNNETGEYIIKKEITGLLDYDQEFSKSSFYDSYVSDRYLGYRSELFPVNQYVFFQIPSTIKFDEKRTIDGTSRNDSYNVSFQIWGNIGRLKDGKHYIACYKSVDNFNSKFDFIVKDNNNQENCSIISSKIKLGEIIPENINGNDFILMKVFGFRFYSSGICTNVETCKIYHKFNLKYYLEKKSS